MPAKQLVFRGLASLVGFEPTTNCLEGRCSVPLSYRDVVESLTQAHMGGNEMGTDSKTPAIGLRGGSCLSFGGLGFWFVLGFCLGLGFGFELGFGFSLILAFA